MQFIDIMRLNPVNSAYQALFKVENPILTAAPNSSPFKVQRYFVWPATSDATKER